MHGLRLLVMSDLHQGDGGRQFDPADISVPFDVAVVAGDCAGRLTDSISWLASRFAGRDVMYVPGNHDYYRDDTPNGFTIEEETRAGRELADRLGIHLLSDGEVELHGIRFLGSTLWTDLSAGVHHGLPQAIGEARRGMNDYKRIHRTSSTRRSRRIDPAYTRSLHRASLDFLEQRFACHDDRPAVVVTHHAPSLGSLVDPSDSLNHCYASDLEAQIMRWRPAVWIHGHIHQGVDYPVGATRVVCNPLGRSDEKTGFETDKIVEVGR